MYFSVLWNTNPIETVSCASQTSIEKRVTVGGFKVGVR